MGEQLMTMRDIAALARVQRPVVSVWRRRSRGTAHPFPAAQTSPSGQEVFRRDDVVTWLEETERGNNPAVRADAAVHALFDAASAEGQRRTAETLSALLTLRHLGGRPLAELDADGLIDLADALDPDDECLFTEVARADEPVALARLADELTEAAWSVEAAHDTLLDQRFRTSWTPLVNAALAPAAHRLVAALAGALTRELGEGTRIMDPLGCCVDLLAEGATALGAPVLVMRGAGPVHRLLRRQLLLAGVEVEPVDREDGDWTVTGPVVHLAVLPDPDRPGQTEAEHLDLLDEIAVGLDADQVAVVLGPAAVLSDVLTGAALARRDQLLREGRVRSIVRLPAGLRPSRAREHLALWLLAAPDDAGPAERRTGVADLSDQRLSVAVTSGLTDDLLASWQGREGARRRAWAYLVPVPTAELTARTGSLVPRRRVRAELSGRAGADWAVSLAAADTDGLLAGYRLDVVDQRPERLSVEQAVARGWVRVLPGHRLRLDGLPPGNLAVIGPDDLGDPGRPPVRVDRLALHARADVRLTEPGDIVFTTQGGPRAVLDPDGGGVVVSPARVLRVMPGAPLVPAAILARINRATSTAWRSWPLAVVPHDGAPGLAAALADLAAERRRLADQLARLDALTADLTTAVESGRIAISPADKEQRHGQTTG